MPKSAGRSGASHAMTVNETVIAMIRPKPDLHLVAGEPARFEGALATLKGSAFEVASSAWACLATQRYTPLLRFR